MIEQYEIEVTAFLGAQAIADAKAHALAEFPKESCGFIASGAYVACENKHETPEQEFIIDDPRYEAALLGGTLQAVVHSHPHGPLRPSGLDMAQQIASGVPWVIITLNETGIHRTIAWGGNLPVAPIIGRPFVHGIFDCYSLVRDIFRLGSDELAKQGVAWPLTPIELPEVARDDSWWTSGEQDLYVDHLAKVGFREIARSEVQPGDGFLFALGNAQTNPKQIINHAAVLVERDQLLHHFPTRPSARMPAGQWMKLAGKWVRYEG